MSKDKFEGMPAQVRALGELADEEEARMRDERKTGDDNPDQAPGEQQPHSPADPKPKPEPQPGENWEQKFYTLQGKYNSEVPRLHADNRELSNQLMSIREEMTELKGQLEESRKAPEGPAASKPSSVDKLNPESFGDYGPEIVEIVNTLNGYVDAFQNQGTLVNKQAETIRTLQSQIQGVQETQGQQAQATFGEKLTKKCAEWERLNTDPDFNSWLDENGFRETLNQHAQNGDVIRTAKLFNRYLTESGKAPAAPKTPPEEEQVKKPAQPDLEEHLAPQVNGGGTPPADAPTFSNGDIQVFFQRWSQAEAGGGYPFEACGKLISSGEDAAKLDYEISRANKEGRIR